MNNLSRIENEQKIIEQMIRLYCRKKKATKSCARLAKNCWHIAGNGWNVVRSKRTKARADSARYTATNLRCRSGSGGDAILRTQDASLSSGGCPAASLDGTGSRINTFLWIFSTIHKLTSSIYTILNKYNRRIINKLRNTLFLAHTLQVYSWHLKTFNT